jgi:hypothetical protein
MKKALVVIIALVAALALTNPGEEAFRNHVRERQGIAGSLGMAAAELLGGGIKRENSGVASRFYLGGDGLLPREDLAWGCAGKIWDIKK